MTEAVKVDYPVIVIGAGPSGLSAANALAFEGVKPLVVETGAPGGQAATSHFIENIPGFPDGISGIELTRLVIRQGLRDGVSYVSPFRAQRLDYDPATCIFTLVGDGHERLTARCIVIATGVQNRLMNIPNAAIYFNNGIYYGSPVQVREMWKGRSVGVVGGGNAAAQAAMFLAGCEDTRVHLIVRGKTLADSMSARVVGHLADLPNVQVMLQTEIVEILGDTNLKLTGVRVKSSTGLQQLDLSALHAHIGSKPRTTWLDGCVALDDRGYVYNGRHLPAGVWPAKDREPLDRETSHPGVFVCGTARIGHAIQRVNTAFADGQEAAASAFQYLQLVCGAEAKAA